MKKVNWKVYGGALDALQAQFSAEDGIQIHNCNFARQGTPVKMGVQWASLGTKSPAEAAEYANRILDAAMAAENFVYNGYVVDYDGGGGGSSDAGKLLQCKLPELEHAGSDLAPGPDGDRRSPLRVGS